MMQCLREGFEEILRLAGGAATVTLPARDGCVTALPSVSAVPP